MKSWKEMAKLNDLSGHCAIVTGASGGIGSQFASQLAAKGCRLILIDLDDAWLKDLKRGLNGSQVDKPRIECLSIDLTRSDAVEVIESFCVDQALDPDILINNAGIFSFAPVADTSDRRIDAFLQLHMGAVTRLSVWFARRRRDKGWGRILNMSSMSCWMPVPGIALYSSTKAYIRVFTRALHYEMKDYGVTATAACPGGIATDLFGLSRRLQRFAVAIKVLDTPERFVRNALSRMMKGKKQYINGWLNRVSIVAVALTPTRMRMMVKHKMLDKGITR